MKVRVLNVDEAGGEHEVFAADFDPRDDCPACEAVNAAFPEAPATALWFLRVRWVDGTVSFRRVQKIVHEGELWLDCVATTDARMRAEIAGVRPN